MAKNVYFASVACVLALVLAGCEAAKSANPLSPSVAGPIPGVNITPPKLLEPGAGWQLESTQQPLVLLVENASTNGQRPLTYTFEIATDEAFSNKVYTREGVAQGDNGRTSFRLPDALVAGRTYYWRARAQDGANTGPYSTPVSFVLEAPVVLNAPVLVSPINGETIASNKPTFRFKTSTRSGPTGTVIYALEASSNESFTASYGVWTVPEQSNETTYSPVLEVPYEKPVFWRVRAQENNKGVISAWSSVAFFYAPPTPPPPAAPPSSGGGGGGGGGGTSTGNWQSCGSVPGVDLVACVRAAVNPSMTSEGAFEVTKRVAWLLRGQGVGLLIKNGGENVVPWRGYNFSASRICYSDGRWVKVISDAGPGGTNGASWGVGPDNDLLPSLYLPAIDPSLP